MAGEGPSGSESPSICGQQDELLCCSLPNFWSVFQLTSLLVNDKLDYSSKSFTSMRKVYQEVLIQLCDQPRSFVRSFIRSKVLRSFGMRQEDA